MRDRIAGVRFVWLNGELIPVDQAQVHLLTPAVLIGSNIIEGFVAYWNDDTRELFGFRLKDHAVRLHDSAKIVRMDVGYSPDEIVQAVVQTVRANEFKQDLHIRLIAYADIPGGPVFSHEEISVCIAALPHARVYAPDKPGIRCCTSSWRRIGDDSCPPRVKAGSNYQNSKLAFLEARAHGYDNCVMLTDAGKVSETPVATLFMVRNGVATTPTVTSSILESITRDSVIDLFQRELRTTVRARDVDRTELYLADEVFICGSACEILPVVSLDGISIGDGSPGPVTRQIQRAYSEVTRGRRKEYFDWLQPVYSEA